jgi:hypothetical protein
LSESGATLIVCISDFVAEDTPTEVRCGAIARGASVLALAVGVADLEEAADVAAASDDFLTQRLALDYRFVFRSAPDGAATCTVALSVDGGRGIATES